MKRKLLLVAGFLALSSNAFAISDRVSPEAARLELVTMAETNSASASIERIRALVESYRIDQGEGFMPLRLAPYPRFLLNAQMGEIYPALYQSEFDGFINHIPLEVLFDGVLDLVIKNKVPESMKKDLKQLDQRMAKLALAGKGEKCALDESDKIEKVWLISLIALKIDVFSVNSPCTYRKRLFNAAKEALLAARELPETKKSVAEGAKDQFPEEFRKGFLTKINSTIEHFPELVGEKFGAGKTVHPIWSEHGSIIESERSFPVRGGRRMMSIKSFSQGLLADLFAANALMASNEPLDRSLAAGLFYSVVNRWLLLTGGVQADWDSVKHEMPLAEKGVGMDVPKFREARFGGWGAESTGFGIAMSPWDWPKYDPSNSTNPTALRIFPTRFEIDSAGVAFVPTAGDAYQTNEDLAYLLFAVSEFLKVTQPGMPLAQFFGGKDQIADLMDPKKPMLFPTDGRLFAVGVLSGVAQNLLNPTIGHVGSKRDGIPVYFRDHGRFGPLQEKDIDTRGVCSLLVAASKLTKTLSTDPVLDSEKSLQATIPQISQLVQISALVVGREQGYDGSIPAKMVSADKTSSLGAQIAAVRVFLAALNGSATPTNATFVMARLVPALSYLFTNSIEVLNRDSQASTLEVRMNLLAVWNQSQSALRSIRPDLPWADWEARVRAVAAK
jgi:hypothetical protein